MSAPSSSPCQPQQEANMAYLDQIVAAVPPPSSTAQDTQAPPLPGSWTALGAQV